MTTELLIANDSARAHQHDEETRTTHPQRLTVPDPRSTPLPSLPPTSRAENSQQASVASTSPGGAPIKDRWATLLEESNSALAQIGESSKLIKEQVAAEIERLQGNLAVTLDSLRQQAREIIESVPAGISLDHTVSSIFQELEETASAPTAARGRPGRPAKGKPGRPKGSGKNKAGDQPQGEKTLSQMAAVRAVMAQKGPNVDVSDVMEFVYNKTGKTMNKNMAFNYMSTVRKENTK